jgi:uncharacterized protein YbcI
MHGQQQDLQMGRSARGRRGKPRVQILASDARDELLTAISDGLVGLVNEFYGHGPTHAKSYYQNDLVVCVLRGEFGDAESDHPDAGRRAAMIEQRMEFRELMLDRVIAVVENATSQRVIGFMSGNQHSPDMLCEVFILAPPDLFVPEDDDGQTIGFRGDHGAF